MLDFRFDELHYGKYVSFYMKNMFFFDSQPPLGKQLLAIPAYLAGFDGKNKELQGDLTYNFYSLFYLILLEYTNPCFVLSFVLFLLD